MRQSATNVLRGNSTNWTAPLLASCPSQSTSERFLKRSANWQLTASISLSLFVDYRCLQLGFCFVGLSFSATKPDFKFMEDQLKKCLTGSVKQLGSVFMYSVKSALRQNCQAKNRNVVASRFPISKCLNLVTKDTDVCMEKMISAIQRGKRAEPKNRIGYVCCSYYEYRLCVDGKARPRCPPKVADMILEYFSGVFQGRLCF